LYYKNLFLTASIFIRGATISLNACVVPIIYARPKGYAVESVGNIYIYIYKERKKEKGVALAYVARVKNNFLRVFLLFFVFSFLPF